VRLFSVNSTRANLSRALAAVLILTMALPTGAMPAGAQQATPSLGAPPAAAPGDTGTAVAPGDKGKSSTGGFGGLGGLESGSSSGPVEIDATDGIEWRRDENVYIARGNARAARGDVSITADELIARYHASPDGKTAIYQVEAKGHVVIVNKDSRITGDRAVYDLEKGSAIITGGDLKAVSKDNYVTARDSLEYWDKQGVVVARGDAVAADKDHQIHGDLLTGYFRTDDKGQKKLYQVEATGNVRIDSDCSVARAAKAIYNLENDTAALDGGVKITRGKSQLNGEHAVYNVKTGQARVTGGVGQVKTLLVQGDNSCPGGQGGKPGKSGTGGLEGLFKP
jgi:lipopolysaccharide export system protein LptA